LGQDVRKEYETEVEEGGEAHFVSLVGFAEGDRAVGGELTVRVLLVLGKREGWWTGWWEGRGG